MSWEVPSMKSKTSFFNRAIAKNLLHRCWPLWAAYLILLLLLLPLMLRQQVQNTYGYVGMIPVLDDLTAGMGEEMMILSFGVSILAAMAMFSYLYNTRSCGMMNALPVTRTTMFFTAWLTGLVPLLLCDLLAAALCLPFVAAKELSLWVLGTLLGVMVLSKLCFYGFASLCAMLTGSLIILPLVYAVLSFTAYVAELATRFVLSKVLFGLNPDHLTLQWLSPLVEMLRRYGQYSSPEGDSFTISGLGAVAVYGGVGLLLTIAAWLLYRRRQMESATDTVAIPVLKPVFKYCMAFGCGILLAAFVHAAILNNSLRGWSAAAVTALLVLIGSFLGYFAAEMLIQKTVWVFRGSWRGWLIFAAAALLIIGSCEADLFGWEKSQPKAEHITAVYLNDAEYTEADSIRSILELQRSVVQHKKQHEASYADRIGEGWVSVGFRLRYALDDGRLVTREYEVVGTEAEALDPDSDLAKLQAVINLPEALRWRSICKVQVVPENVVIFQADFENYIPATGDYEHHSVRFTAEEAVDFYQNALLADLAENKVGRRFYVDCLTPHITNGSIELQVTDGASLATGYMRTESTSWYYINLYEDNTHCLDWLRQHCDEEIQVLRGGNWVKCGAAD